MADGMAMRVDRLNAALQRKPLSGPEATVDCRGSIRGAAASEDIYTTEAFYGHYDLTDLERAMEKFAKGRRDA